MNFVKIKDYPYVIHPCGTILRIWKDHTREVKPYKLKDGYMQVGLCKDKQIKRFFHHRLLGILHQLLLLLMMFLRLLLRC